jgi:hypothetical protein
VIVRLTPQISGTGLDQCQHRIRQGACGGLQVVVVGLLIRREFDGGMPTPYIPLNVTGHSG